MVLKAWMVAALSILALAACGGGGGGGNGGSGAGAAADAQVRFDVSRLQVKAFQGQQYDVNAFEPAAVVLGAQVDGELSGTVYAVVGDSGKGFAGAPIEVVRSGPGNYNATLTPDVNLAPGSYSGELVLRLCKDSACAREYSVAGGSIDYRVTILPQLEGTVLVNGARAGVVRPGRVDLPVALTNGSVVEIRTNIPVDIRYSSGPGFVTVTKDRSSTKTEWKAVIALDTFPTTRNLHLNVIPIDGGQQMAPVVNIDVVVP